MSSARVGKLLGVAALSAALIVIGCGERTGSPPRVAVGAAATPSRATAEPAETAHPTGQSAAPPELKPADGQTSPPPGLPPNPIPVTEADPSSGSPDALVTLVQFVDLQCPFSSRVQPTLGELREKYRPEDLRIVWKHNPLPFHKSAPFAHQVASTIHRKHGNAAFWAFVSGVFENQSELSDDAVYQWAAQAGLVRSAIVVAADSSSTKVREDLALGREVGVTGTPAFRINGIVLSGAQPRERFEEVIDAQLSTARQLRAGGADPRWISHLLTAWNFQKPKKAAEKPPDRTVWRIPVSPSDPRRGPDSALVTIVEFADYQCPFCQRVEGTIERLLQEYPADVRVVWKDNPLPFHQQARDAAEFARHAFTVQGNASYWRVHDSLFESQSALGEEAFRKIADGLKLSWQPLKAALDGDKYAAKVDESMELAAALNARGTPHFFINGRRLAGAQPYEVFKELVEQERGAAVELTRCGVPRSSVYAKIMESAKEASDPERRDLRLPDGERPSRGPANAKYVVHEFADFQCPFCSRVQTTLKELRHNHPKDVRIEFRNLPLDFHRDARLAAEAAMEVFAQKGNDGFWAFHDLLFENNQALSRTDLLRYASGLGVDVARLGAALDDHRHLTAIEADIEASKTAGISGTPAFVINGYFVSGAQPLTNFETVISRLRKDAQRK